MTNNTQTKWKIDQKQKNINDVAYIQNAIIQVIIQLYPTEAEYSIKI